MLSNYKKKPQGSTKFFISNSPKLNRRPGCAHIAFKKKWLDDTAISICLLCSAKTVFASHRDSCRSTLSTYVQFPSLIAQATLYREHFFGSEGLLLSLAWIQPHTSRQSHIKWTGTLFQPLEWSQTCCGVSWHGHGSADVQEPALWPSLTSTGPGLSSLWGCDPALSSAIALQNLWLHNTGYLRVSFPIRSALLKHWKMSVLLQLLRARVQFPS